MAVSRLMRSGVRFKQVGILTDLIGSVKGWRSLKVHHPRRRSDHRVAELVLEGMAGALKGWRLGIGGFGGTGGECGVSGFWGNGLESPFSVGDDP